MKEMNRVHSQLADPPLNRDKKTYAMEGEVVQYNVTII